MYISLYIVCTIFQQVFNDERGMVQYIGKKGTTITYDDEVS